MLFYNTLLFFLFKKFPQINNKKKDLGSGSKKKSSKRIWLYTISWKNRKEKSNKNNKGYMWGPKVKCIESRCKCYSYSLQWWEYWKARLRAVTKRKIIYMHQYQVSLTAWFSVKRYSEDRGLIETRNVISDTIIERGMGRLGVFFFNLISWILLIFPHVV